MANTNPIQLDLFEAVAYMHIDKSIPAELMPYIEHQIAAAKNHVRFAAYPPAALFSWYRETVGDRMRLFDTEITINRHRVNTFVQNTKCVCCGIEGNVFFLERHKNDQEYARSLNLYAIKDGSMVLMTVDHVLPDSLAGRYSTLNFQTMCSECNRLKQNFMSADEIARVRANMDDHVKSWAYRPYIEMLLTMQEHMLNITEKRQRAKWAVALTKASRNLVQGKSHEKYMVVHMRNLQQTLNNLLGIKPVVVAPPVIKLTTYQRFRAWVTAQVKLVRSIRIVVQPA